MALSSHIMKNKERLFSVHAFCALRFYRLLSYPCPSCLFSWLKRPTLLNHSFRGSFPDPLPPSSSSLTPFQFCLSIFEMWRRKRYHVVKSRAALWTQSHIMKLFLFHSVSFPVTPTAWVASMAAAALFIEIWVITPRSFFWIV